MIPALTVNRTPHRVNDQSAREGFGLDPRMQRKLRIEWLLRTSVGYDFNRPEKSASPDISHIGMFLEYRTQPLLQIRPFFRNPVDKPISFEDPLDG